MMNIRMDKTRWNNVCRVKAPYFTSRYNKASASLMSPVWSVLCYVSVILPELNNRVVETG